MLLRDKVRGALERASRLTGCAVYQVVALISMRMMRARVVESVYVYWYVMEVKVIGEGSE